MTKGEKYLPLRNYLEKSKQATVQLSFEQIEKIINEKLPPSAFIHPDPWWANNRDHTQAIAWMDAGYKTENVANTYGKKYITFVRIKR